MSVTGAVCQFHDTGLTNSNEPSMMVPRARARNCSQGGTIVRYSTNVVLSEVALGGVHDSTLVNFQSSRPLKQRAVDQSGLSSAVYTHACTITSIKPCATATDGQGGEVLSLIHISEPTRPY